MSSTVRQQWIRHEIRLVYWRVADLTRSIGSQAQAFERTIDVIEGGFDSGDAFVAELWHADQPT